MNSCAPVHPLADAVFIEQAVCNVAERSFFAFAERAHEAPAPTLAEPGAITLSAVVSFTGPAAGYMRVTMPLALTRELATMFSGDPTLVFSNEDLIDMAGEFANMVTGAWLTATDAASTFDLGAPVVMLMAEPAVAALMMQINGQPVGLSWRVE